MSSFFDRMCVLMRSIHLPGPGPVRYAVYADIDIAILQEYNVTLKKGGWGGGERRDKRQVMFIVIFLQQRGCSLMGDPAILAGHVHVFS